MRMARRSKKVHGMVDFPVHTESTNEGGMFVRLWAVPYRNAGLCCGTDTNEWVGEIFLGTDTTKNQLAANEVLLAAEWSKPIKTSKHIERLSKMEKKLYHKVFDPFVQEDKHGVRWSVPLVGSVLMGSTGWSDGNFICTYENLNEKGKMFYDLFKSQYPDCKLHLLTFLDT